MNDFKISTTDTNGDMIVIETTRGRFTVEFYRRDGLGPYSIMSFDAETGAELLAAIEQALITIEEKSND